MILEVLHQPQPVGQGAPHPHACRGFGRDQARVGIDESDEPGKRFEKPGIAEIRQAGFRPCAIQQILDHQPAPAKLAHDALSLPALSGPAFRAEA